MKKQQQEARAIEVFTKEGIDVEEAKKLYL
jgi:hypothetical protein